MTPQLSLVLPAYNEEGNIERAVREAAIAAAALTPEYELVVVDDGSRDDRKPGPISTVTGNATWYAAATASAAAAIECRKAARGGRPPSVNGARSRSRGAARATAGPGWPACAARARGARWTGPRSAAGA